MGAKGSERARCRSIQGDVKCRSSLGDGVGGDHITNGIRYSGGMEGWSDHARHGIRRDFHSTDQVGVSMKMYGDEGDGGGHSRFGGDYLSTSRELLVFEAWLCSS